MLNIEDLKVYYRTRRDDVRAVDGVSFELRKGELLGLVGESGCGKSTLGYSLLRLIRPPGYYAGGTIHFNGRDLLQLNDEQMRQVRGKEIALIPQAAMNVLNPVIRIKKQMRDMMVSHEQSLPKDQMSKRVAKSLTAVKLDSSRLNSHPHELSGGMRQRVIIALSLLLGPKILVADEPTTALDVVTQRGLLRMIRGIAKELELSILFITHDISILAEISDRIGVMYAGKLVEISPTERIFSKPAHPYTKALLSSVPSVVGETGKLEGIPGYPPDLRAPPAGCRFHPRCPYAVGVCERTDPPFVEMKKDHTAACHLAKTIDEDEGE
ncbi:MAG: ABC transporter ATP-binding protein [Candidatus Bipolaricaulia bacterium]